MSQFCFCDKASIMSLKENKDEKCLQREYYSWDKCDNDMDKDAVRTEAAHTDEFVIILLTEGQKWPTG